jgi:hypothetical protein
MIPKSRTRVNDHAELFPWFIGPIGAGKLRAGG